MGDMGQTLEFAHDDDDGDCLDADEVQLDEISGAGPLEAAGSDGLERRARGDRSDHECSE